MEYHVFLAWFGAIEIFLFFIDFFKPEPEKIKMATQEKQYTIYIYGKEYNVTKFLDEHPGGRDVLTDLNGKDATRDFNDVGHSAKAKEEMEQYFTGKIDEKMKESAKNASSCVIF